MLSQKRPTLSKQGKLVYYYSEIRLLKNNFSEDSSNVLFMREVHPLSYFRNYYNKCESKFVCFALT